MMPPAETQHPHDEASYWQGYREAKQNLRSILALIPEELHMAAVSKWLGYDGSPGKPVPGPSALPGLTPGPAPNPTQLRGDTCPATTAR